MATAGALTVDQITDSYMRETSDFEEDESKNNNPKMPPENQPNANSFDVDMPSYGQPV
jgi:hypothetical protein